MHLQKPRTPARPYPRVFTVSEGLTSDNWFRLRLPPREDECPHRIHLLIPHRLWVRLLREVVEREPKGARNGGGGWWLRLPLCDGQLVLQLLQKLSRHLLHRYFLGLG